MLTPDLDAPPASRSRSDAIPASRRPSDPWSTAVLGPWPSGVTTRVSLTDPYTTRVSRSQDDHARAACRRHIDPWSCVDHGPCTTRVLRSQADGVPWTRRQPSDPWSMAAGPWPSDYTTRVFSIDLFTTRVNDHIRFPTYKTPRLALTWVPFTRPTSSAPSGLLAIMVHYPMPNSVRTDTRKLSSL